MSNQAHRKEKQRLKREKRKAVARRAMSVSPYKRVGQIGEMEACYINANWQDTGLASIHLVRRNPAGGHALACFLIDIWCAGLKDAWGRLDLMMKDVDHTLDRARDSSELIRIDVQAAKELVAGAIRFARQNGFKLPPHYDCWINVLGGIGDVANADLSSFGKDGKLCWIGSMDDLSNRLIASTAEEFLARPDVLYMSEISAAELGSDLEDEDQNEDDEEDEDDDELFEQACDAHYSTVQQLSEAMHSDFSAELSRRGQNPQARLRDAIKLLLIRPWLPRWPGDDHEPPELIVRAGKTAAGRVLRELFGDVETPEIKDDLKQALQQVAVLAKGIDKTSAPARMPAAMELTRRPTPDSAEGIASS